jgi:hypothetical protein
MGKCFCVGHTEVYYICEADRAGADYSECEFCEQVDGTPVCGACVDGHCTSYDARAAVMYVGPQKGAE